MIPTRRDSYDIWRHAKFGTLRVKRVIITASPTIPQGAGENTAPIAGVTEFDGARLIGPQFFAKLQLPHSQISDPGSPADDFLVVETPHGIPGFQTSVAVDPNGLRVRWQEFSPYALSFPCRITGTIAAAGGSYYSGTGMYTGILGDFYSELFSGGAPCIIQNILEPGSLGVGPPAGWILGTSVLGLIGYFAGFDSSTPPKPVMHVYESCPLRWQMFAVRVTVDNGVTTYGTPTYTAKDSWGATIGTGLTPLKPRPTSNMVPPNSGGDSPGVGYIASGSFQLWDVGEYPYMSPATIITSVNFSSQTTTSQYALLIMP